jgi:hypothetical protein
MRMMHAWSSLEGHFEKKSQANKLFLRRRFLSTIVDDGDDVLEHINKLSTLVEQLDAVGAPVSEDDLVVTLLSSLSESYQSLITLEARSDTLTRELVISEGQRTRWVGLDFRLPWPNVFPADNNATT